MTTSRREIALRWRGDGLVFDGSTPTGARFTLDGDSAEGPSPTELVLSALGGCMAVDIRVILEKSRVPLNSLEVVMEGDRAPEPPRRFERIRMTFRLEGPREEDEGKILRAIQLSTDKYCSVYHTLRSDIEIESTFERI